MFCRSNSAAVNAYPPALFLVTGKASNCASTRALVSGRSRNNSSMLCEKLKMTTEPLISWLDDIRQITVILIYDYSMVVAVAC